MCTAKIRLQRLIFHRSFRFTAYRMQPRMSTDFRPPWWYFAVSGRTPPHATPNDPRLPSVGHTAKGHFSLHAGSMARKCEASPLKFEGLENCSRGRGLLHCGFETDGCARGAK